VTAAEGWFAFIHTRYRRSASAVCSWSNTGVRVWKYPRKRAKETRSCSSSQPVCPASSLRVTLLASPSSPESPVVRWRLIARRACQ
jgi:hypothetical protein